MLDLADRDDVPNPWEQKNQQVELIKERMSRVKHKIAVISGKGGVGKSLVTVNLAMGLAVGYARSIFPVSPSS